MLTSMNKPLGTNQDAQAHGSSLVGMGEPYAY